MRKLLKFSLALGVLLAFTAALAMPVTARPVSTNGVELVASLDAVSFSEVENCKGYENINAPGDAYHPCILYSTGVASVILQDCADRSLPGDIIQVRGGNRIERLYDYDHGSVLRYITDSPENAGYLESPIIFFRE